MTKEEDTMEHFSNKLIDLIKGGELDGKLSEIDSALAERTALNANETAKNEEKKEEKEKRLGSGPKRKSIGKPVKNRKYKIAAGKLAGTPVKFLRFKQGDESVAIVQVLVAQPGYPESKKIGLPIKGLVSVKE